ncbi:hypothetical protein MHYP_G00191100 [Metynnis hypsauchen]
MLMCVCQQESLRETDEPVVQAPARRADRGVDRHLLLQDDSATLNCWSMTAWLSRWPSPCLCCNSTLLLPLPFPQVHTALPLEFSEPRRNRVSSQASEDTLLYELRRRATRKGRKEETNKGGMESAGVEDSSVGFCKTPGSSSPLGQSSEGPAEAGPEESPEEETPEEEEEVVGESEEERGPLRCLGLAAASCCVCVELEQVRNCVRSEKICILPILACLLSLALCTAGLKWVFVDKIFEYEPPTHLDPKRIGQDPIIIDADPTLGLPISFSQPNSPPAFLPPTTTTTANPGQPAVFVEGDSTAGPFAPASPKVSRFTPTSAVTIYKSPVTQPLPSTTPEPDRNSTPSQHPGVESNNIITKTCKYTCRLLKASHL